MPSAAALSCTLWTRSMMLVDRRAGKRVLDLLDEEVGLVGASGEAEQREREERQRHEREQREVGDHRGEVRAAVGEELPPQVALAHPHGEEYRIACAAMDAQQALADLTEISSQIQAAVALRRAGRGRRLDARRRRARGGACARRPPSCSQSPTSVTAGEARLTQLEVATRRAASSSSATATTRHRGDDRRRPDRRARLLRPEDALRNVERASRSRSRAPEAGSRDGRPQQAGGREEEAATSRARSTPHARAKKTDAS